MAAKRADGAPMAQPTGYVLRMAMFVAAAGAVVVALHATLLEAFMANPPLNGLIAGVAVVGILFCFRQVMVLRPEIRWVNAFRMSAEGVEAPVGAAPSLLAPLSAMIADRYGPFRLTAPELRSILDSTASRLDEKREIARYLIGLLVFLGLLGTFWGLLGTVSAVGETIRSLSATGEAEAVFGELRQGLEAPLSGMGTAFSSSLFGLAGSLVLGFLDLQAGQAQNRFYNELEEWLSAHAKPGASGPAADGEAVPAYVAALLEQTAESLEALQRTLMRSEERRTGATETMARVAERLETLADHMRTEGQLMSRLAETQSELKGAIERLARGGGADTAAAQLRSIDTSLKRLVEEQSEGREQFLSDLRGEVKLLARTIAAAVERRGGQGGEG